MSLVLPSQGKGVTVVVGLPAHLDGRLHVKCQVLVLLQGREGERDRGRREGERDRGREGERERGREEAGTEGQWRERGREGQREKGQRDRGTEGAGKGEVKLAGLV